MKVISYYLIWVKEIRHCPMGNESNKLLPDMVEGNKVLPNGE